MSTVPSFQLADLRNKIVLIRMDHNVVKKGKIKDTMRIDATIPTLLHIYKHKKSYKNEESSELPVRVPHQSL